MPESTGPRSFMLPADTAKDTRILYYFQPSSLPVLFGVGLAAVVLLIVPLPLVARLLGGVVLPGGTLVALAADVPARVARRVRLRTDGAHNYLAAASGAVSHDVEVRARFPGDRIGTARSLLPPGEAGRDGDSMEMERIAWIRVGRRLKAARATAVVSAEMVPDLPPRPGWEVPADLPVPPGTARFAAMRAAHFQALVDGGRARRPQVLLRVAGRSRAAAVSQELYIDRLTNGIAAELQGVGVLAVPVPLGLLDAMAGEELGDGAGTAPKGAGAAAPNGGDTSGAPGGPAEPAAGKVSQERGAIALVAEAPAVEAPFLPPSPSGGMQCLRPGLVRATPVIRWATLPTLLGARLARSPRGRSDLVAAGPVATAPVPVPSGWPDPEGFLAATGLYPDLGLAVLGALPRVGASTALAAWAAGRADAAGWTLLDANAERPGGLSLAVPIEGENTARGEGPRRALDIRSLWSVGPGRRPQEPASPVETAAATAAAIRRLRDGGAARVAVDLGSPPALDDHLRAHPLVRLAAERAAAVAVVTRQDAAALFAAHRLLNALRACGAGDVRVWVAAYDTRDAVTLAEMAATFGEVVEEAPGDA